MGVGNASGNQEELHKILMERSTLASNTIMYTLGMVAVDPNLRRTLGMVPKSIFERIDDPDVMPYRGHVPVAETATHFMIRNMSDRSTGGVVREFRLDCYCRGCSPRRNIGLGHEGILLTDKSDRHHFLSMMPHWLAVSEPHPLTPPDIHPVIHRRWAREQQNHMFFWEKHYISAAECDVARIHMAYDKLARQFKSGELVVHYVRHAHVERFHGADNGD